MQNTKNQTASCDNCAAPHPAPYWDYKKFPSKKGALPSEKIEEAPALVTKAELSCTAAIATNGNDKNTRASGIDVLTMVEKMKCSKHS